MPTLAIVFGLSSLLVSKVSKEGPKDVYVKSICDPAWRRALAQALVEMHFAKGWDWDIVSKLALRSRGRERERERGRERETERVRDKSTRLSNFVECGSFDTSFSIVAAERGWTTCTTLAPVAVAWALTGDSVCWCAMRS